jgi:hypothetical protein
MCFYSKDELQILSFLIVFLRMSTLQTLSILTSEDVMPYFLLHPDCNAILLKNNIGKN